MARGFESKSAQSQQQDAEEARAQRGKSQPDREVLERTRRREGIEMSRRRIERELQETSNDRRREQLRAALEHLDGELRNV
jgi:hypothetical protein